jgi:hypothetical protein
MFVRRGTYDAVPKKLGFHFQHDVRAIAAETKWVRATSADLAPTAEKKNPGISGVQFLAVHVWGPIQAALISIFFVAFWASAFLGNFTVRTPLLKAASIFSGSTLSGSSKLRWKEPKLRSCR